MKRLMFAILAIPFVAGCWSKKSDVVTTPTEETNLEKTEELIGADEEMSEGMTPASTEDEK